MDWADPKPLTQAVWRSYRLKYGVLGVGIVFAVALASSVRYAQKDIDAIGLRSVQERAELMKASGVHTENPKAQDPGFSDLIDQMELAIYRRLPTPSVDSKMSEDQKRGAMKSRATLARRISQLERNQADRESAYSFTSAIPFFQEGLKINTFELLDFWPVVLICIIGVVRVVGVRQRAIEIILAHVVGEAGSEEAQAVRAA